MTVNDDKGNRAIHELVEIQATLILNAKRGLFGKLVLDENDSAIRMLVQVLESMIGFMPAPTHDLPPEPDCNGGLPAVYAINWCQPTILVKKGKFSKGPMG